MNAKSSSDVRLLVFLPWLHLAEPTTVVGVEFIPFPTRGNIPEKLPELADPLSRFLASYVDIEGKPLGRCTVATIPARVPGWSLQEDDTSRISDAVALLFLCAISQDSYFSPLGSYANSTQLQILAQQFEGSLGPESPIIIHSRRRDGPARDLRLDRNIRFMRPQEANSYRVEVDHQLAEALTEASHSKSDALERTRTALPFFTLANTDSYTVSPQAEIVFTASAFGYLLKCDGNRRLAKEIGLLFKGYDTVTVQQAQAARPKIVLDPKGADKSWFVHQKWLSELYCLRNEYIHGKVLQGYAWHPMEHLLISRLVFVLVVKLLLAKEGHYKITPDDEGKLKAVDQLLSAANWEGQGTGADLNVWQDILEKNRKSAIIMNALAS